MSRRSITSERAFLAALVLVAACGGGDAPAPPDISGRDGAVSNTDRAASQSDRPANASDSGYDGDRAVSQSDQPSAPQPPPPPAMGGRPNASGGSDGAPAGRAAMGGRGEMGGRAGTGGTPNPPPGGGCTVEMDCECGDDLCETCLCLTDGDTATCEALCN
jgi:hypothetical protein